MKVCEVAMVRRGCGTRGAHESTVRLAVAKVKVGYGRDVTPYMYVWVIDVKFGQEVRGCGHDITLRESKAAKCGGGEGDIDEISSVLVKM